MGKRNAGILVFEKLSDQIADLQRLQKLLMDAIQSQPERKRKGKPKGDPKAGVKDDKA